MPGKRHVPTDELRVQVERAAGIGLPHEQIATLLGITDKTLRKKYRRELDLGMAKANVNVANAYYREVQKGNPTLLIWWTKTRLGWKEDKTLELKTPPGQPLEHRHTYGSPEILQKFYAASEAASQAALPEGGTAVGGDDEGGD